MSVVEGEFFWAQDLRHQGIKTETGTEDKERGSVYDIIHQAHSSWTCIEKMDRVMGGRESVRRSAVRCYLLVWDAHQAGVRRVDRRM